jgi:hypothetical protein
VDGPSRFSRQPLEEADKCGGGGVSLIERDEQDVSRYATIVTSVLVPLLGVVLGAAGALLGTYLSTRVTKQQAQDARVAAIRAERKAEIEAFLEVAQSVEQAAELRYQEGGLPPDVNFRTHQMWFRQKCIELICSADLNQRTVEYAFRMHHACYREMPKNIDVWDFIRELRDPFLAAARHELGIGQPLI